MNTRAYKEYEPVRYPENGVKVLYDARVEPGAKAFPLHWHERMELIRVVEGSLECHVDDTRFIVKTGELAIACPMGRRRDGRAHVIIPSCLTPPTFTTPVVRPGAI